MTWDLIKDVALFAVAIWGAVLSTIIWRQGSAKDSRLVKVQASTAMLTMTNGQLSPALAKITAVNVGQRIVTISLLAMELPDKRRLFAMRAGLNMPGMADTVLPTALSDGQSAHLYMLYREIGEALQSIGVQKTKIFRWSEVSGRCLDSGFRGADPNVRPATVRQRANRFVCGMITGLARP
ncbi:hypothetical protein [Mesorhizobium sp. 131-2-5]|uniref:hypothetical protein n=1 Tax=Mesorhizobium sp. 131-2-5 TaxID=2744519 RepID=UPI0019284046|nr:hypothetical protein [Mesorhizobium sp. 131-2-5]